MRRTQIYITEDQERLISDQAADAGVPKAELIRRMLDQALGLDAGDDERRRAILATAGLLPDADDWPRWLARVRGAGAEERLQHLEQ
ncbi:hypothetical protein BH20ACT1_BH20ACT1_10030 [soil metagenome]|jgi:hypothetical protein